MNVKSESLSLLEKRIILRNFPFHQYRSRLPIVESGRHLISDFIRSHNDIYGYYGPVSGQKPPSAASMFDWSSAVYSDVAIPAAQEAVQ